MDKYQIVRDSLNKYSCWILDNIVSYTLFIYFESANQVIAYKYLAFCVF